jgi:hypothetical protein
MPDVVLRGVWTTGQLKVGIFGKSERWPFQILHERCLSTLDDLCIGLQA